ncbi:hypothetical protein [Phormidium nigroviride]
MLRAREEGEDGNRISEFSETQNVLAAKKVAIELTQDSRYTAQKGGDFTTQMAIVLRSPVISILQTRTTDNNYSNFARSYNMRFYM